jgi:hypothetical protein
MRVRPVLPALLSLAVPAVLAAQSNVFQSSITAASLDAAVNNAPDLSQVDPLVIASGNIDGSPYFDGSVNNRGNGFDGVVSLQLNRTDGTFLCSGTLLQGGQYILTAAHCLANDNGANVTTSVGVNFFPGPSGNTAEVSVNSTSFYIKQGYTGNVIDRNDLAIIALPSLAPLNVTQYSLYGGNPIGQTFDFAGFGDRGSNGAGYSADNASFLIRRDAFNVFDFDLGTEVTGDGGILISDFDNGNPLNDADYYFGPNGHQLGVANEGSPGPGDSGGPAFISVGGQNFIAGVVSFGARGTNGGCTPNPDPPPAPALVCNLPDTDGTLDASFGEEAGWVTPDANLLDFVHYGTPDPLYVTPEPASLALLITGLLALAGLARRRRRIA